MTQSTIARGILLVAAMAAIAAAQTNSVGRISAQVIVGQPIAVSGQPINFSTSTGGPMMKADVTGQPFSAQEETQTIQTLADGTHITNGAQKVMHYRDSLGRTRTERTPPRPPGFVSESSPPVFIEIVDPVGGYRYQLDSNSRVVHRSKYGPGSAIIGVNGRPGAAAPGLVSLADGPPSRVLVNPARAVSANTGANPGQVPRPRPEVSHEALGSQNIEGVLAEGVRTTTTWPVGFFGNDRPIVTVTEIWTSRELGMPVLTTTSDPRNGETTMKLTNISLAEPDPSLFQPPAGYEIEDPESRPVQK